MLSRTSRSYFCRASSQPWLFVGLGNPGDKFKGTRHNVGFEMIDAFAKAVGIPMDTVHCKAVFGKGFVNGNPVFLSKPQTYMNLSGESEGNSGPLNLPRPCDNYLVNSTGYHVVLGADADACSRS